ncbi:unnamed protein product [Euphydryas editha]|uniref:Endonuclease-reverse transcriptase n=1 Tax=Euphydryas editha TaxID=104508 RepID=A0AAU9T964_EUPED|nr:unnamed protein product [Euphydryas editha]
MSKQTKEILAQLDEKLVPLTREIDELRFENEILKEKIYYLEKHKRANNIILYGLHESEDSIKTLIQLVKKKFKDDLNIIVEDRDINTIYRLGKIDKQKEKRRPILISFVNNWKKSDIMKNKNKLNNNIYASEDYPKDVLNKRRELQSKLEEERKKGNYAIINYDRLIVKEGKPGNVKRKRDSPASPSISEQPCKQQFTTKANRRNAFDLMRNRSNSFPTDNHPSKPEA